MMRRAGATKIDAKEAGAALGYIPLPLSSDHPQSGLAWGRRFTPRSFYRRLFSIFPPILYLHLQLSLLHRCHLPIQLLLYCHCLPIVLIHVAKLFSLLFASSKTVSYFTPLFLGSRATSFLCLPQPDDDAPPPSFFRSRTHHWPPQWPPSGLLSQPHPQPSPSLHLPSAPARASTAHAKTFQRRSLHYF